MLQISKTIRLNLVALAILMFSGCILTEEAPSNRNASRVLQDVGADVRQDARSEPIEDDTNDARASEITCTLTGDECTPHEKENETSTCLETTLTCIYGCKKDYADCDGKFSNGCEVRLDTPENCNSCGNKCEQNSANLKPICVKIDATANSTKNYDCSFSSECAFGYELETTQEENGTFKSKCVEKED